MNIDINTKKNGCERGYVENQWYNEKVGETAGSTLCMVICGFSKGIKG